MDGGCRKRPRQLAADAGRNQVIPPSQHGQSSPLARQGCNSAVEGHACSQMPNVAPRSGKEQ